MDDPQPPAYADYVPPVVAADPDPARANVLEKGLPSISPDRVEQDQSEFLGNSIPSRGYHSLRVVTLGGSAGCIPALQRFFEATPPDTGMAFVVIMHLAPDHDTAMPLLLGKWTQMEVKVVEDRMQLEADTVYMIPPGKLISAVDGHLLLTPLEPERGRRVAVDLFFRSLADTHGPHATAIVLSGADGDGTIGIKRIKERGGLTIAQEPHEAEHHSMPQSAIATGMVDWVLPASEMPRRILDYAARQPRLRLPLEEGPQPAKPTRVPGGQDEAALREVLAFLRARTGRDFSYYKRATILRRISRRMQISGVDDLQGYLSVLRTNAGEAGALLQDLLISVTNFFRDRESFAVVESLIPSLFKGKTAGDTVRVWVAACATGEEAYSMAMLLLEHARTLELPPSVQVFGCDLDPTAIQVARMGMYPEAILADVSQERLQRFFLKESHGYRIRREVREVVLFASHDLLKDAPFSRMDLVSCRNLLIYLERDAQRRALEIFHFAVRARGLLFLGSSETVDEASPLFEPVDKKHRVFRQTPSRNVPIPVYPGGGALTQALAAHQSRHPSPVLPNHSFGRAAMPPAAEPGRGNENLSSGELHFRLLERYAPPSVLVNAAHEIVHLSESAGKFLRFAGGTPTTSLMRVVPAEISVELRAALLQAVETGGVIEVAGLSLEIEGERREITLRVAPAREVAPGFLLITFERGGMAEPKSGPVGEAEPALRQMEREIERTKAQLRDTGEQYEANTEELKASNEELQAMNEELRSASEELETSREELQSINEELATVNHEFKEKIDELAQTNSDLQNLMAATPIATIFLDRELRITRFTPQAVELFRLIPGDIGRPLADLRHNVEYPELQADAASVLDHLVPVERQVRAGDRQFLARLLPYRTHDDRIAGIVLSFVDVTELKKAEEASSFLATIVESSVDSVVSINLQGVITSWNASAEKVYGYAAAEVIGKPLDLVVLPQDLAQLLVNIDRIHHHQKVEIYESVRIHRDGHEISLSIVLSPVKNKRGEVIGVSTIARDNTEQLRAQADLIARNQELERFNRVAVGREVRMAELKEEINDLCERYGLPLRYKAQEVV